MPGQQESTRGIVPLMLKRLHDDREGGVSIETVLIIAAIALPILVFLKVYAWPQIKKYFVQEQQKLFEDGADPAATAPPSES